MFRKARQIRDLQIAVDERGKKIADLEKRLNDLDKRLERLRGGCLSVERHHAERLDKLEAVLGTPDERIAANMSRWARESCLDALQVTFEGYQHITDRRIAALEAKHSSEVRITNSDEVMPGVQPDVNDSPTTILSAQIATLMGETQRAHARHDDGAKVHNRVAEKVLAIENHLGLEVGAGPPEERETIDEVVERGNFSAEAIAQCKGDGASPINQVYGEIQRAIAERGDEANAITDVQFGPIPGIEFRICVNGKWRTTPYAARARA